MDRVVALYLRLSKMDERMMGQKVSESITNQKVLLERYAGEDEELCNYRTCVFVDDGFSGLEDNRPGLRSMLSLVQKGKVYAVVVKDLSRLSRNHLYLATLCEKVFPINHTELIALGDGYDSRKREENLLAVRFKSLFYEYYSRDISRKVKASLEAKKEQGEYAVAKAPFGYCLADGEWKLEEREAELVRSMFELAAEGYSNSEIVRRLEGKASGIALYPVKVYRILQNPVYCGKHIWHKYESRIGIYKRSVLLPRESWRVEPGSHPAIISEELFEQVQRIRKFG